MRKDMFKIVAICLFTVGCDQSSKTREEEIPSSIGTKSLPSLRDAEQELHSAVLALSSFVRRLNEHVRDDAEHAGRLASLRRLEKHSALIGNPLYEIGGAGLAARFAAEERIDDEAISALYTAKSTLERSLRMTKGAKELLSSLDRRNAVETLRRAHIMSRDVFDVIGNGKRLLGSDRNWSALEADYSGLLNVLSSAITQYNGAAMANGRPALKAIDSKGRTSVVNFIVNKPRTASISKPLTEAWLVGTWAAAANNPNNDPAASCETDVILRFSRDGSFRDGGAEGRYRISGQSVEYYDLKSVPDVADEVESFVSETLPTYSRRIRKTDKNTFDEEGDRWRRCASS